MHYHHHHLTQHHTPQPTTTTLIKAIQYHSITLASTETQKQVTIPSINLASTTIIHNGLTTSPTNYKGRTAVVITLLNDHTLYLERYRNGSEITIELAVVTFNPALVEQRQTIEHEFFNSGNATLPITPIDPARTILFHHGTLTSTNRAYRIHHSYALTENTVTIKRHNRYAKVRTTATLITFKPGVITRTHTLNVTLTGLEATQPLPPELNLSRTWLSQQGYTINQYPPPAYSQVSVTIDPDTHRLIAKRGRSNQSTIVISLSLHEFNSQYINTLKHSTHTLPPNQQHTPHHLPRTTKTLLAQTGYTTQDSQNLLHQSQTSLTPTQIKRGKAEGKTVEVGVQLLE